MLNGQLNIAFKFAEIDDKPYSNEHEGWVSRLVEILQQTLAFYFDQPIAIHLKKETDLIGEQEFMALDAIIYILSPAFLFSSNLTVEISAIEKAVFFDTDHLNSKIHKILKGPVNVGELPVTISMGAFHYFYQLASTNDNAYETLFDWDTSAAVRNKYWDSFTNLLLNLLKSLKHPKQARFMPPNAQTFYLGTGDMGQLWNRTHLLGELSSRGVKVLPDHDHSIEVKHLKEPVKFYLKKSDLAVHFPEEFLPLDTQKLQRLADMPELKRYIWFDPEAEKELEKKKLYDELKQKLKDLDHVEVVSAGLEELKEIIFAPAARREMAAGSPLPGGSAGLKVYLIWSNRFEANKKEKIMQLLYAHKIELLFLEKEKVQEMRAQHYRFLKEADCCLICYEGMNGEWVRANINEVKKATGLHPEKKQRIKLGLIAEGEPAMAELKEYYGGSTLFDACAESLKDDLHIFLNGR